MKNRIIFCTGGARSGKSEFAETLALSKEGQKGYIATGQAYDEEMKHRIHLHQERRKKIWNNYEIPYAMSAEIQKVLDECSVVLIDCLTMWTTNLVLQDGEFTSQEDINNRERFILSEVQAVLDAIRAYRGDDEKTIIFVTNEIGLGIVPENKLARIFRDIMGRVNRMVAAEADEAYMTISGITIDIKALEVNHHG
ncbi:bifunctional adenosylcobinamide kinase/adenosylcobinamide-phosphate guanylyltransferase [Veillonella sp. VA137]|uniref:bifunctional adenosylcobinamide kinase/adenosylcobinamide-phosphate guanylyltransferase n=1 Tax=Veillonella sp. VA137 TaxID=741828 RepID=UPI000F8D44E8|nr:bifunctional adenosylcobinamide kinase/adenosylcobinamide-phosphate guanylyltransferase [Veillonella sp. VA137]